MTHLSLEAAERKVAAIDKRIDAVCAEMFRVAGIDWDALTNDLSDAGSDTARHAATVARRDAAGYAGIEHSLYLRRYDATVNRDKLLARAAKAAERAEVRELQKKYEASRHACPTCGDVHYAA